MGFLDKLLGRRQPKVDLPAQKKGTEAVLDAVLSHLRAGHALSDADLVNVANAMGALWRALCAQHGTEDNTRFPAEDQAYYLAQALKAAAIGHPNHDAWPVMSDLRRHVHDTFKQQLAAKEDPWLHVCAVMPALLQKDVKAAQASFRRIQADPFYRTLVLTWANYAESAFSPYNDVPSVSAFLAGIPDNDPWNPTTKLLDDEARFPLLASVYPFLPRDPRLEVSDPREAAISRLQLQRDWNITDRDTAWGMLEWLRDEGHRSHLAKDLAHEGEPETAEHRYVRLHRAALQRHQILAWDLSRLTSVARAALGAGYLEANETWTIVRDAGQTLRAEYVSWDAFADDFLLGMGYWDTDAAAPDTPYPAMVRWLKESPRSPWKRMPWRRG